MFVSGRFEGRGERWNLRRCKIREMQWEKKKQEPERRGPADSTVLCVRGSGEDTKKLFNEERESTRRMQKRTEGKLRTKCWGEDEEEKILSKQCDKRQVCRIWLVQRLKRKLKKAKEKETRTAVSILFYHVCIRVYWISYISTNCFLLLKFDRGKYTLDYCALTPLCRFPNI